MKKSSYFAHNVNNGLTCLSMTKEKIVFVLIVLILQQMNICLNWLKGTEAIANKDIIDA